jgi:hypothetical protein
LEIIQIASRIPPCRIRYYKSQSEQGIGNSLQRLQKEQREGTEGTKGTEGTEGTGGTEGTEETGEINHNSVRKNMKITGNSAHIVTNEVRILENDAKIVINDVKCGKVSPERPTITFFTDSVLIYVDLC